MSNLNKIAKEANVAKSTVSKVLNHCGGVDYQIRQHVLNSAKSHIRTDCVRNDIYIILPDNPKYFWKNAYGAVSEHNAKYGVKLNLYSNIANSEDVIDSYLEEAQRLKTKVLIITGILTAAQIQKLEENSDTRLTILLCVENPVKNAFFIGADSFNDGLKLAENFLDFFPFAEKFLLVSINDSEYSKKRSAGFVAGAVGKEISQLQLSAENSMLIPAVMAREMSKLKNHEKIDCVISIDGITGKIYTGINKLKLKNPPYLIGFECSPFDRTLLVSKKIQFLSVQNIHTQTQLALEYAALFLEQSVFPDKKNSFVSSALY